MTTQPHASYPVVPVPSSDKVLMILCHVSALLGVGFVLPFIVWLVKRNDPDRVAAHAAAALNFHLSLLLYMLLCIPLVMIMVGIPLLILIGLGGIVLAIVAAVRASDGVLYRYPLTIRFVR